MVCKKCEKKLSKLAAPSPFELTSTEDGKRKIGENKLLSTKTPAARLGAGGSGSGSSGGNSSNSGSYSRGGAGKRYSPYTLPNKCKDCRSSVTQNGAKYCHSCAYKKGICSICSKQIVDTKMYTMSTK